jgi:hypothetical protein
LESIQSVVDEPTGGVASSMVWTQIEAGLIAAMDSTYKVGVAAPLT